MQGGVLKGYYGLYDHVPGILEPPAVDFAVLLVRKLCLGRILLIPGTYIIWYVY